MLEVLSLPASLSRLAAVVSARIGAAARATQLPPTIGLFVSGAVWGFLPCAMVYGALFYAMLSGSWLGALAMSGFGLGTLPVLFGAGLGLPVLRRRATAGWLRNTVALAIIAVGIVSAGMSPSTLAAWCRS